MLVKSIQSSEELKDDSTFTGNIDNNFTSRYKQWFYFHGIILIEWNSNNTNNNTNNSIDIENK